MESKEANEILKQMRFEEQMTLIISGLAGRDFLINPWPVSFLNKCNI